MVGQVGEWEIVMAESSSGIGYVLYCPATSEWLGKLGEWYSDIRLASVYAEPRAARMARARLGIGLPIAVVPIHMSVRGVDIETATARAVKEYDDAEAEAFRGAPQVESKPGPKPAK